MDQTDSVGFLQALRTGGRLEFWWDRHVIGGWVWYVIKGGRSRKFVVFLFQTLNLCINGSFVSVR